MLYDVIITQGGSGNGNLGLYYKAISIAVGMFKDIVLNFWAIWKLSLLNKLGIFEFYYRR